MTIAITTAASNHNLIEVATARAALGISDHSEDAALQGFVARASDVIARHCKRVFALETVQETFRLDRYQADLIMARYPVVELVSIVENAVTLAASDYDIDRASGIVTRLCGDRPAYWSTSKIVVSYRAGYALPSEAPQALKQAALQLVKSYAMGADRDPMVRSEALENVSSAGYHAEHMPPDVIGLLQQFRNVRAR